MCSPANLSALPAPTDDVLATIGNTPLVELKRFDTGLCRLFVKLENQNPGGSIKDRIGLAMIRAAEAEGRLQPGGVIVEATAGNTGLGLALVAASRGYRCILVIPDKMAQEKVSHLKALGAEVRMTRSDVGKGHPEYYQDMAERIAAGTPGAFYVNQFANPANPRAHEETTGPEIWEQMGHDLDAVVCGIGSGGTITGLGRFFRQVAPQVQMVLADPEGSVLAPYLATGQVGEAGSWAVEGIGEDFLPPLVDLSLVSEALTISDRESFATARALLREQGILAGSSSGTLVAAAVQWCRRQREAKRVVTFVCDSGNKYLSKMFNDYWLRDHGYLERPRHGDLRDLIGRPHAEGATTTVGPDDTLSTAYNRMQLTDVSQLPVIDQERVVGIVDESDILLAVYRRQGHFSDPVRTAMSEQPVTLAVDAPIDALLPIFDQGYVAMVVDGERFLGLITRIDFINYLRRQATP